MKTTSDVGAGECSPASHCSHLVLIEAGKTIKWKGVDYYIKEVFRSRFGDMKVRLSALHGRDHCIVNLDYLEDTL